jgi:hypothetical protein
MTEGITTVRYVSGDWSPDLGQICLRVESDQSQVRDLLFAPADIQPLVVLLLVLSGRAGSASPMEAELGSRHVMPLRPDFLALGETDDGDVVIQFDIGPTRLAFSLPASITTELGQSLLAMSAQSAKEAAN